MERMAVSFSKKPIYDKFFYKWRNITYMRYTHVLETIMYIASVRQRNIEIVWLYGEHLHQGDERQSWKIESVIICYEDVP